MKGLREHEHRTKTLERVCYTHSDCHRHPVHLGLVLSDVSSDDRDGEDRLFAGRVFP